VITPGEKKRWGNKDGGEEKRRGETAGMSLFFCGGTREQQKREEERDHKGKQEEGSIQQERHPGEVRIKEKSLIPNKRLAEGKEALSTKVEP